MASKILGITIDIEGKTSGLTKSLQEANSSINKTTSALKDVDKALKLDPTNVELLAQKEELLNKQIEQTSNKLDIMRQVANDANDALARGDISQEQYASLTAELVRTETALSELESEANGAADGLEDTANAADEAGAEAEESSEAMEQFGEAAEVAGEVAVAALEAVVATAAAVGAAVVGAMIQAGTALTNATLDTSKLADEILTLSSVTGLSTDTLQELNYASELLDVDTQTVTGSMTKLLKTMSSAADGNEAAAEKFTELGISIYDAEGNIRSTEDVFWDAIDVLGSFESETERDLAAMDLFGKSARELNPLIEAGSETFGQLADEAREVGYVLDGETLDAFGALDDNMQRLSNGAQAVEQSFGQVLLPLLTDLSGDAVSLLGEFSGALAGAGGDIDQIGAIIEQFAPQAVSLVEEYFPKILTIVESVFNALIPVVISVAPQLLSLIGNLIVQLANSISENSESFIAGFTSLFQSVVDSALTLLPVLIPLAFQLIQTLTDALLDPANLEMLINSALGIIMTLVEFTTNPDNLNALIMAATTIITSLLNGLTQALPILIPAALNAILTVVDTLLSGGSLAQIMEAALTLIVTLASSLIQYLPQLIARLPEIILGIVKFLTGEGLPMIIEAGFQLITGIIGNLPQIIVAIIGGLVELIVGMVEYITGDGADDILDAFQAAFDGIIKGASSWGSDIIQNLIDGIGSMISGLVDCVSGVAETIADFLHFSVPEKGPLADFDKSGGDMIEGFIDGMESKRGDLIAALNDTAGLIATDMGSFDLNAQSYTQSGNGLSVIEQAITAQVGSVGATGATWIFPIYIGTEHIDTIVVDALDRANYLTGGH